MSYYLIFFFFFLNRVNCLLTSVCFTVYFPWLQTMTSFLMHANSVTNLVKFFCVFKIHPQSIPRGRPFLAHQLPPGCFLRPRTLPPRRQASKALMDSSDTSGVRLCPCLASFSWIMVSLLLSRKMLSLHQLVDTPPAPHFHLPAFPHVPGVRSLETWSSINLPPVRQNGGGGF